MLAAAFEELRIDVICGLWSKLFRTSDRLIYLFVNFMYSVVAGGLNTTKNTLLVLTICYFKKKKLKQKKTQYKHNKSVELMSLCCPTQTHQFDAFILKFFFLWLFYSTLRALPAEARILKTTILIKRLTKTFCCIINLNKASKLS